MKWTREKPKERGTYWLDCVVRVTVDRYERIIDVVHVSLWENSEAVVSFMGDEIGGKVEEIDGLWYGPIFPPER